MTDPTSEGKEEPTVASQGDHTSPADKVTDPKKNEKEEPRIAASPAEAIDTTRNRSTSPTLSRGFAVDPAAMATVPEKNATVSGPAEKTTTTLGVTDPKSEGKEEPMVASQGNHTSPGDKVTDPKKNEKEEPTVATSPAEAIDTTRNRSTSPTLSRGCAVDPEKNVAVSGPDVVDLMATSSEDSDDDSAPGSSKTSRPPAAPAIPFSERYKMLRKRDLLLYSNNHRAIRANATHSDDDDADADTDDNLRESATTAEDSKRTETNKYNC